MLTRNLFRVSPNSSSSSSSPSSCIVTPVLTNFHHRSICCVGKKFVLQGELLRTYEDFVLGKIPSLSQSQIEKFNQVNIIEDDFINANKDWRFEKVTSIDISMFTSVRQIGADFLCLPNLKNVDLSVFSNSLSFIRSGFLSCSHSKLTKKYYLDQLDLRPLIHIDSENILDDKLKEALERVRSAGGV